MPENASDIARSFVRRLQARSVSLLVKNGRLRMKPPSAYRELSDEELLVLRHHRAEITALVASGLVPSPSPPIVSEPTPEPPSETTPVPEPEPEVYVYGIRVREEDVLASLRSLGDEVLASYRSGELAKSKAYDVARRRLRQLMELH